MAKLNVEVLDMVSGEITKIAYDGTEYAKVDDLVKSTEDILLAIENGIDRTKGEFYRVISVGSMVRWEDNTSANGVGAEYIGDRFEVFRKISADKPTLEQRVENLESNVAALKGEKKSANTFKIGDSIKVVRNTASWGKKDRAGYHVGGQGVVKVGAIGEVTSVSGDFVTAKFTYGDVNGDSQRKKELRFDEIELAEETIEFEGSTYRKVEREAREGDVVIFKGVEYQSSFTEDGVPYKVIAENTYVLEDGDVYSISGWDDHSVDVYEPIEQAKYVPQEGDIVVITANTSSHANSIGDIGKVGKEEPLDDGGVKVYVPGGPLRAIRTKLCDIRKATPAEVEKYEQAMKDASKPKLKAGDFVKFKRSIDDTKAGKPYLIEVDPRDGALSFKDDAGDFCDIDFTGEYEILSAEEAKWAKIGRKPNEFKKGDIIECGSHGQFKTPKCLYEVSRIDDDKVYFYDNSYGCGEGFMHSSSESIRLISPVESLFNANA